jgi:hypothetical protein
LVGLLAAPAIADVVAGFDPPVKTVLLGSGPFTIDIVADMSLPIVGWGLDLTVVTPSVADRTATPPVIGPDWNAAFAPDLDGLAGLRFPNGFTGHTVLATVEFTPLALGSTDLLLSVTPGDLTEGFAIQPPPPGLFDVYTFNLGQIVVTPEPSALVLLALAGLALRRR